MSTPICCCAGAAIAKPSTATASAVILTMVVFITLPGSMECQANAEPRSAIGEGERWKRRAVADRALGRAIERAVAARSGHFHVANRPIPIDHEVNLGQHLPSALRAEPVAPDLR